ncbi:sensor histidine kinase [Ancylomarina euxinus]|uniref:histidine kinase n=1 Tax=Ancylomarina euxinus TaxID=2283627 RepID=A0A425Y166_9BACT|nr:HAMP domain-containing sensor histidine kinase [Ancylomarina euxinus]MCZ4693716.1 HAMP domain-containing sensor histidine kinase [Ancylomarina euxinus]MUP15204.1 hypothetical protein [Ancylomarina euxinus]RRG21626.1 sensor histidine kinase [Ancylomarina euxinus]
MNKKLIIGLIVLMSISLIGIIGVQVLWIQNNIRIEEKKFDDNIKDILETVVENLEQDEDIHIIGKGLNWVKEIHGDDNEILKISEFIDNKTHQKHQKITITGDHDSLSKKKFLETRAKILIQSDGKEFKVQGNSSDDNDSTIDININLTDTDTLIRIKNKEKQIENLFSKVIYEYKLKDNKLEDRIDQEDIANQLKLAFQEENIDIDYQFGVSNKQNNKLIFSSDSIQNPIILNSKYKQSLFPGDVFKKNNQLFVAVTNRGSLIYKSILPLLILSGIFTLFILASFVATVIFIFKQKKISDIKTDFINNMTHEFKTPIATIALASDSIVNPKVIGLPERIRYFAAIIKDENYRMNKQVENIMQLSLYGKHELEINPQALHLNESIQKAAEHILLQIDERKGSLNLKLDAINDIVKVDEVHFFNVLFNLLDNAIKYSEGKPEIEIGTKNVGRQICVWIKDSGMGMNQKTQKRIFKKFYRAQTGNIHKVKGFGLGLSYVKLIVDRHMGDIKVTSKIGQGTCVEISLPLNI